MADALVDKYTEMLAKTKGITPFAAAKAVERCLRDVSAKLNIPYDEVFAAVFSEEFMAECLNLSCEKLTLEQCRKACHCVEFEDACIDKKMPEADAVNADPDKFVVGISTEALEKLVKRAAYLYHNFDGGGLTDNSFDALEYHLNKRLKLRGRRYEKIGAPPVERIRTKLPYPMASLDKVKPDMAQFLDFINPKPMVDLGDGGTRAPVVKTVVPKVVWSLKLDGVSCLAVYKKGKLTNLYTRGDGTIGGDVTYLRDYITIPKEVTTESLVVRGELILTKRDWEKYKLSYANARSFVSAKVNSAFVGVGLTDIRFVAYEIYQIMGDKNRPSPSQSFKILEAEGFLTPENGIFAEPTAFLIAHTYREKRASAEYTIDGLVLAYDVGEPAILPGSAVENPKSRVAFKMQLEEMLRPTKVIDVEWNISRYGRFVPVAIFESVYIDGARIHRASAFNAAHVRDWNLGRGTEIVVTRSGDVIPQIKDVKVNHALAPIYPVPRGSAYDWSWKGHDIVLNKIDGNPDVELARITHFFSTMGVRGVGEGTVKKLFALGYTTIASITNAKMDEFRKIPSFGDKRTAGLYNGLHTAMQTVPLDRYLEASTFQSGIGRKLAKDLFRAVPNLLDMTEAQIRSSLKSVKVHGFGPKRIEMVAEGMPKFRKYLDSLSKSDVLKALANHKAKVERMNRGDVNKLISGKMFVTTGFYGNFDLEIEDYIYDNLGDFGTAVTSDTAAVIAATLAKITDKMTAAYGLKVPVYTLDEFAKRFGVNVGKFAQSDIDPLDDPE